MKYWKRILPLLLVLAMLAGYAVPVAAQEDDSILSLNETKSVTISWYESKWFTFVPETDGYFAFVSSECNGDPYGAVYDANMNLLEADDDGGHGYEFVVRWWATAGETYHLEVSGQGTYNVQLQIPGDAEAMGVFAEDSVLAVGKTTGLWVEFYPSYCFPEDVTFSSSDETVATVDQHGTVLGVSAGTAMINVTSEKGLSDVWYITVEAPLTVTCGEDIAVVLGTGDKEYTFVPETDGWYGVYSVTDWEQYPHLEPYVRIEDADNNLVHQGSSNGSGAEFFEKVYLSAGAYYYFSFTSRSYHDGEGYVARVVPLIEAPTGLEILEQDVQLEQGQGVQLHTVTTPAMAWDEAVTFTSSDNSVAMVDEYGYVYGVAAGTATVTATSESGLTATCTVTVTQRPVIELDQIVDVDAADGEMRYTFIPQESGWYAFCSQGEEVDTVATIYDEDGHELSYDDDSGEWYNFCVTLYMEAGTTYVLQTDAYWEEGAYQIWLQEIFEPTAIELDADYLDEGVLKGFAGQEGRLWYRFVPAASIPQSVTWSSSDESVVTVDEDGNYCLVGAGTATITVTAENGIAASCTVTVKDILDINIESPVTFQESDGKQLLRFVPETSDDYVFYSIGKNADPGCSLLNSDWEELSCDWDSGEGDNFRLEYPLIAGEVYYLQTHIESLDLDDGDDEYTVYVHEAEEATGIELSYTQITEAPEAYFMLEASMVPRHARQEELTWTSSDPNVVYLEWDGVLYFYEEGTAVITVTSESGFTATCTVNVQYPEGGEPIQCGQPATFPAQQGSSWFEFVPEEDGWYLFTVQSDHEDASVQIYNDQWEHVWGWGYEPEEENTQCHGIELKAGQTYYLRVAYSDSSVAGNFTVAVEKMEQPTELLLNYTDLTGYVTDYYFMEAQIVPQYAIPEVTWTSSDEAVVTVSESGVLLMKGPGTATVTATAANGVSATCTVTVSEPPLIEVGDTKTLYVADGRTTFRFIPETDGWYGFYTTGEFGTYGYIQSLTYELDYDIDIMEESNRLVRCRLEAGQCYYLTFYAWEDQDLQGSYELHAATLEKAQQILLKSNKMSGYVGDWLYPEYQFQPILSEVEDITWTSSDETVAIVNSYDEVECIAPGTAVITATTDSGLTDSVTVRVEAIPQDAEDYGDWGDDLLWQIKDGVLTVTGTGDTYNQPIWGDFTRVELPEGLTGLGSYAFEDRSLESLTVPASVTSIGERAFAYTNLSEIRFLGHVPAIGEDAFYDLRVTAYYPANDPTWTEEVRQNYGGNVTWVPYEPEEVSGFALEGKVKAANGGATTVELLLNGDVIDAVDTSADQYRFEDLAPGTYTLRVSKEYHVTREYTVTVANETVTQDVKIHLLGDIDGGGTVNMGDLSMQYAHIKGTKPITDEYQLLVANVNGGILNMGDFAALYAHIKGTKKLY